MGPPWLDMSPSGDGSQQVAESWPMFVDQLPSWNKYTEPKTHAPYGQNLEMVEKDVVAVRQCRLLCQQVPYGQHPLQQQRLSSIGSLALPLTQARNDFIYQVGRNERGGIQVLDDGRDAALIQAICYNQNVDDGRELIRGKARLMTGRANGRDDLIKRKGARFGGLLGC